MLTISKEVVELHGAVVDGLFLCQHAVDVQHLHVQPGKGCHVKIVQGYGHQTAEQL